MSNPTFMRHMTMAVHEDRVRALQRSRRGRSRCVSIPVRRAFDLYRWLVCRRQVRAAW